MMTWAALAAIALAMGISLLATPLSRRVAQRFGMLDVPAKHKTHARPIPLLGGSAIFAAILGISLLALSLASVWAVRGTPNWVPDELAVHISGAAAKAPMALGILAGALLLHVIGLIDDVKNLAAPVKLIGELAVCTAVVLLCKVRILTVAGPTVSVIVSVLWLAVIINAFNFLDNMDGLSAGVAGICAAALLAASAGMGQVFVSAWLCLILGALCGFLPYNFPPASTFMGDAGSLVVGYLLGVASCLTTYVQPDQPVYLYGVFVPLVLMAIPLYDSASVVLLRLRERRNPMVGDRRHFSHRLLRRGMSVRRAVLTIYLCTFATAIAASLLPHVAGPLAAALVLVQTLAVVAIIALLEFGDGKS
ncbi:MAG: MraY family glycosyltransferase [Planctomycetota bacterium]|nr:MraY family glycosyltransferase [Planctomycetota bacterium]